MNGSDKEKMNEEFAIIMCAATISGIISDQDWSTIDPLEAEIQAACFSLLLPVTILVYN